MKENDLLFVYNTVIRPGVEYSHTVYHSLIPEYLSLKLETVQKQAMKVIFGHNIDYNNLIENGTIESLKSRREQAVARFAVKAASSPRFGPAWFKKVDLDTSRAVRQSTRDLYLEK